MWSHSGKELFYLNGAFDSLWSRQRCGQGPRFAITGEKILFATASGFYRALNYRQYDISPDDKRFIMTCASRRAQEVRLPTSSLSRTGSTR